MSTKDKMRDYAQELQDSFYRWDYLNEYGGQDPFYHDGVNMNLVRNHIIYYKDRLSESDSLFSLPDCYYRETPPKVEMSYMARPDEIRINARLAMEKFESNDSLEFICEQSELLPPKLCEKLCLKAVMGYADNLRHAIEMDDLVTMRRYGNPTHYLEGFDNAAEKIRTAISCSENFTEELPPLAEMSDVRSVPYLQPEPEADEQQNIGLQLTLF